MFTARMPEKHAGMLTGSLLLATVFVLSAYNPGFGALCGNGGTIDQSSVNPPKPIVWQDANNMPQESQPFILVFDTEESKEIKRLETKIKLTDDEASKVCFVKAVLTAGDLATLFPKKADRSNSAESGSAITETRESTVVTLGRKYEIKSTPFIIGCDTYGNCLQIIQAAELNTPANALKITKDLGAKQKELEINIPKSYEQLTKKIKSELEKRSFPNATINELIAIAKYSGYKNTDKAQGNLDEMNKIAGEELNALTGENKIESDPIIVNKLENFVYKFKGLPAANDALKIIQDIKNKPKSKATEK